VFVKTNCVIYTQRKIKFKPPSESIINPRAFKELGLTWTYIIKFSDLIKIMAYRKPAFL